MVGVEADEAAETLRSLLTDFLSDSKTYKGVYLFRASNLVSKSVVFRLRF